MTHIYKVWEHYSWGDSIVINGIHRWKSEIGEDRMKLNTYGFLSRIPREGDEFHVKMKSGYVAAFRVDHLRLPLDPPDMFYADVLFDRYLEEVA